MVKVLWPCATLFSPINNGTGGLLQPTPLLAANASANHANNNQSLLLGQGKQQPPTAAANVGTTWKNAGNININLDNLLGNGAKGGGRGGGGSGGGAAGSSALSMNQLKSINSSPVHQPATPLSPQSPYGAGMAMPASFMMAPGQQQQRQPPVGMMMGGGGSGGGVGGIGGGVFLNGNSSNSSTSAGGGAGFGAFNAFQ
ncbi:ubiquitin-binding protein Rv1468c-like [Anopheles nili]|uniref:ubiquitin-binding protein Rv1468c-like n=1 Tax=Anopheles nili TaxID=185578 RepID=UPI00237C1301|nr:ubiquitin-binding protein Rv1468c-like [Anopheles nili]